MFDKLHLFCFAQLWRDTITNTVANGITGEIYHHIMPRMGYEVQYEVLNENPDSLLIYVEISPCIGVNTAYVHISRSQRF